MSFKGFSWASLPSLLFFFSLNVSSPQHYILEGNKQSWSYLGKFCVLFPPFLFTDLYIYIFYVFVLFCMSEESHKYAESLADIGVSLPCWQVHNHSVHDGLLMVIVISFAYMEIPWETPVITKLKGICSCYKYWRDGIHKWHRRIHIMCSIWNSCVRILFWPQQVLNLWRLTPEMLWVTVHLAYQSRIKIGNHSNLLWRWSKMGDK